MKTDLGKKANRIAGAIVDLVERTDGPVTLCEVGREVRDLPSKSRLVGIVSVS